MDCPDRPRYTLTRPSGGQEFVREDVRLVNGAETMIAGAECPNPVLGRASGLVRLLPVRDQNELVSLMATRFSVTFPSPVAFSVEAAPRLNRV